MQQKNILIIDDDVELGSLLNDYLSPHGIKCHVAISAESGIKLLKNKTPDLVILDVMLPDVLGFDVCKEIRKNSAVPIIMLSARGEVYDRVLGLELGADDYLAKPFEPRELLARIDSVLRRHGGQLVTEELMSQSIRLNLLTEEVTLNSKLIDLTRAEFLCLKYLMLQKHRVLSREQILNELRGLEWELDNRSVDILISRVRKKLDDDPKHAKFIATIRGSGYRFID